MFPGFKFSPTDVELITYYLKNKLEGLEKSVEIIPQVEICAFEPWELPGQSLVESENEWFFFYAQGRKYPNGLQSKRATAHGYWKATKKEQNVKSGKVVVGTKRTLVFHIGRAPKGERTEWIMHEYNMQARSQDIVVCRLRKNSKFHGSSTRGVDDENQKVLEGCMEQSSYSDSNKAFEFPERHTSSYNSLCSNNVDSASENAQTSHNRLTTLAGPSTDRRDFDEHWFSEMLRDEIIKLDEPSLSIPELVFANKYEPVPAVATTNEAICTGAEQALSNSYLHFLSGLSENKHCFLQFLSNNYEQYIAIKSVGLWHFHTISLLVLLAMVIGVGKPYKMFLDLFASSKTCGDYKTSAEYR